MLLRIGQNVDRGGNDIRQTDKRKARGKISVLQIEVKSITGYYSLEANLLILKISFLD